MNLPIVSIIVPIYNTEEFLDQCIWSIRKQTYQNLDIILINDGSIDGSLSICKKHQEQDERVRIISQDNQGLIAARKKGVITAYGKFIGFVDSDDWIAAQMYESMMNILLQTDCDLVSCGMIEEWKNGSILNYIYDLYNEGLHENLDETIYSDLFFDNQNAKGGLMPNLCSKLLKKELLCEVYNDIDSRITYGEDAITTYAYCMRAKKIYILKEAYYHYNRRQGSMCSSADKSLEANTYLLYEGFKNAFENSLKRKQLMRQARRYIFKLELRMLEKLCDINTAALGTWSFTYDNSVFERKIIIYGAGGCGQALYHYITRLGKIDNIAAWVDRNPESTMEQCLYDIEYPDIISERDFTYIIIAIQRKETADDIRKELEEKFNLQKESILWKPVEYIRFIDQIFF